MLESDPPNQELKDLLLKLDGRRYSDMYSDSSGDEDSHMGLNQQGDYPRTDSEGILYTVGYFIASVKWCGWVAT